MGNKKILIGSISYAIKAKRLLAREGITANVVKETDRTEGCSYEYLISKSLIYPS